MYSLAPASVVLEGVSFDDRVIAATFSKGHQHEAYQIGFLQGGVGYTFYRGAYRSLADELIVFESGEPHAGRLVSPTGWLRRSFLDVEPGALRRIASVVADRDVPALHFPELSTSKLLPTFKTLSDDLRQGLTALEAEERTVDALALLILRHADAAPKPRPVGVEPRAVGEVRDYLEACLTENVSLARLGEVTQMNWDYLRRVFRAHTGVSPHRYQVLLRLERAKHLLLRDVPLAQVALAVGFADQAHLTRAFKRHLEVTPGRLVAEVQNVQDTL